MQPSGFPGRQRMGGCTSAHVGRVAVEKTTSGGHGSAMGAGASKTSAPNSIRPITRLSFNQRPTDVGAFFQRTRAWSALLQRRTAGAGSNPLQIKTAVKSDR